MPDIYLKNKNYSVDNLPSEPSLLVELLDLCYNDNANFEMFSAAIQKDPALSAKILQVANSPAYRQWNEVKDIRRMLIVLGLTNVRGIVMTCAIQQFFANFSRDFNRQVQYTWLRSLICANLAERLARLVGYEKPGEAFLAGLLHQVGMLLLLLNRETEYLPMLNRYYQQTEEFHLLEQQALELDHCELGAALVESWQLDSFVADAIHFQRAALDELRSSPVLMKIIAVAAPLSSRNGARRNPALLQRAGELLDLTEATTQDCLATAVDTSQQMIADLGFSRRLYQDENETELFSEEHLQNSRESLAERVRDLALGGSIGRAEARELLEMVTQLRTAFHYFFGIARMCFFRSDDQQSRLFPVNDQNIAQLEEIEIPADDPRSLVARCFRERQILAAPDPEESLSIVDRQMRRLLGREGLYLIPLTHQDTGVGVLALGVDTRQSLALDRRKLLIRLICRDFAARCSVIIRETARPSGGLAMVDFRKVAHEVSNPLTIINNYLYTLGKKIAEDHPAQEELQFIHEEIERVGQIMLRAKDPAAAERKTVRKVDINQLLRELDTLLQGSLYKTRQIVSQLTLDEDVPAVYCARDKLKQILINILKNAAEACEGGGSLTVVTRDNCYQDSQRYVEILIRDDGPGIPPEILDNLFQPVTSTKEGHSGLGLSIVQTLVSELSGQIACHSRAGWGTEFKILIPRIVELIESVSDEC